MKSTARRQYLARTFVLCATFFFAPACQLTAQIPTPLPSEPSTDAPASAEPKNGTCPDKQHNALNDRAWKYYAARPSNSRDDVINKWKDEGRPLLDELSDKGDPWGLTTNALTFYGYAYNLGETDNKYVELLKRATEKGGCYSAVILSMYYAGQTSHIANPDDKIPYYRLAIQWGKRAVENGWPSYRVDQFQSIVDSFDARQSAAAAEVKAAETAQQTKDQSFAEVTKHINNEQEKYRRLTKVAGNVPTEANVINVYKVLMIDRVTNMHGASRLVSSILGQEMQKTYDDQINDLLGDLQNSRFLVLNVNKNGREFMPKISIHHTGAAYLSTSETITMSVWAEDGYWTGSLPN